MSEEQLKALMVRGLDGDAAAQNALLTAMLPLLRVFLRSPFARCR